MKALKRPRKGRAHTGLPGVVGDAQLDSDTTTSIYPVVGGYLVKMKVGGKTANYGTYATVAHAMQVRDEVRDLRQRLPGSRKRKAAAAPHSPNPLAAVTPVLPELEPELPGDMRNLKRVNGRFYLRMMIDGNKPENLGAFDTYEEAVKWRTINWIRRDQLREKREAGKAPQKFRVW